MEFLEKIKFHVRWRDCRRAEDIWDSIRRAGVICERSIEAEPVTDSFVFLSIFTPSSSRSTLYRSLALPPSSRIAPPPSLQPFTRHTLNCLVQNEPGVLSRVSGILAARGFNIDSLVVCATEIEDLSRMCIVLRGQDGVIEQARRQLEDLVSFLLLRISLAFVQCHGSISEE